uniref:Transmembrane protein n=1 Tax=Panagrellus redivivus TaxID=6233 RepID=A0A7E4UM46_PANRE
MWFLVTTLILSILSLGVFLTGVIMAVFELTSVAPAVFATVSGLVGCAVSAALWLSAPRCIHNKRVSYRKAGRNAEVKTPLPEHTMLITPDATEALMKSIRGIPYLIQAIQYSLETSYYSEIMNEMGQHVLGNSVIHTAPGCTSVLDCESECEHNLAAAAASTTSATPRCSGPEEQWEATELNRWSNPQLRLSMNRRASSLLCSVFPYSESRPDPPSAINTVECASMASLTESEAAGMGTPPIASGPLVNSLNGSMNSQLSRVTVSHTSLPNRDIRCIGMSSAFITRFNSSFKTHEEKDEK